MVRYSRRSTRKPRKRRSPGRTLRRRRVYAKRGRRYKRYSRYPRRVQGPAQSPKRSFRSHNWLINNTPGATETYAFRVDKNIPFDDYTYTDSDGNPHTITGSRQHWKHKMVFPSQGDNTWERLTNRIYVHGLRFTFDISTMFNHASAWLNGDIHLAVIQMHDNDTTESNIGPTFSVPIGAPSNDNLKILPLTASTFKRADAVHGKIRNPGYNMITHRKYHVVRRNYEQNRYMNKHVQFYLPIKKQISFMNQNDLYGTKPFYILAWWIPHNDIPETDTEELVRWIKVDHFRYVNYYRNMLNT